MDFVDDGQKAIFENFIEDAWEQISERYERFGDEETGHARSLNIS